MKEKLPHSNDLSHAIDRTLEELISPIEMNEELPHQLQFKRKKKQQKRIRF